MFIIRFSGEPPSYIFWYYQDDTLSYDSSRGGVSIITEKGTDITTSWLLIQSAQPSDSGEYRCKPSNANMASIRVHVVNGKVFFFFNHICMYYKNKKMHAFFSNVKAHICKGKNIFRHLRMEIFFFFFYSTERSFFFVYDFTLRVFYVCKRNFILMKYFFIFLFLIKLYIKPCV